ncbi:unnamed protein product [Musa acuminata var. zebrina]
MRSHQSKLQDSSSPEQEELRKSMAKDFGVVLILSLIAVMALSAFCIPCVLSSLKEWWARWRNRGTTTNDNISGSVTTAAPSPYGLDPELLSVLMPAHIYSAAATREKQQCAVCITELRDGDEVRHLARCLHLFHVDCIDVWLRSYTSCPFCRAMAL